MTDARTKTRVAAEMATQTILGLRDLRKILIDSGHIRPGSKGDVSISMSIANILAVRQMLFSELGIVEEKKDPTQDKLF